MNKLKSLLEEGGCDKEDVVEIKGNSQMKKFMSRFHFDVATPKQEK